LPCPASAAWPATKTNLLPVATMADAVGEHGEGPAVVEIRSVNDVSRGAELIGERADAAGQTLGVVEQDQLSHRLRPWPPAGLPTAVRARMVVA
jgi:hypothetical protein